jgi:hemolysin D
MKLPTCTACANLLRAIKARRAIRYNAGKGQTLVVGQPIATASPNLDDALSDLPPRGVRNISHIVASLFVVLVIVSSIVSVDVVIAASGRLIADAPTIVVQPMHLSIIREMRVKSGDVVHKGDVLASLDPTFTQADKLELTVQQNALRAQINRLEAELSDAPLHLDGSAPDSVLQMTLYNQRRSQYTSRLRAFEEDIQRFESAILSTEQNRSSLQRQADIAKEVEGMRGKLFHLKVGTKLNYLDAQVGRMRTERDYEDTTNHLNELRHNLVSTQAERQVFIDEWRRNLLEELIKARKDASSVAEALVKAVRMDDLVVLTAPEDGIVLDVAKRSVGSVMQGAEPLVTLVPTTAALIAEVMIGSADVGYTKLGDDVAIKVDAFPYQRHGLLHGWLRSIGEDSFSPYGAIALASSGSSSGGGGVYHRSQVVLMNTKLRALPDGTHLIPGMTLTAEIKVGSRSVISYFLYPVLRGFSESIREP